MKMNRREILKATGGGILMISGISLITGCGSRVLRGKGSEPGKITGLTKEEYDILYMASLAPSGHNAQPWTVKVIGAGHWIIGSEPTRWLPQVDPENRELLLSVGAFLENLDIAAGVHGFRTEIRVIAKKGSDPDIADLRLVKDRVREFPMEKVKMRRTIRKGYTDRPLKKADLDFIIGNDKKGARIINAGSREDRLLREGTIEANRVQAWRDPAQEELSRWIRFSREDAEKYRNGITPASMEIEGAAGWFVSHFFDSKSVLSKSFREKGIEGVVEQVRIMGGWLLLSSRDSSVPEILETGRRFQRIWLRVRERKIAIHPMTQMLEEKPWMNSIRGDLGVNGQVQFILRAGYVKSYPAPVSLRMPVAWFMKS